MLPSHLLLAVAAVWASPVSAQFGNIFQNMFKQQQQQQQPENSWIEHTYDNGKSPLLSLFYFYFHVNDKC